MKTPLSQSGISLVEVTVAILVLSIGVLGLAGMQVTAKRTSHEAVQRSVATGLASEILERMRANPGGLDNYATAGVGQAVRALPAAPALDCTAACTAEELVLWDLWEWERAMNGATTLRDGEAAGGLVNPVGCVTVVDRLVTVEIAWQGFAALSYETPGTGCGAGLYAADDVDRQLLRITSYLGESI
ncbi:MAG: type IV pilus modification protein PilV [Halioglobus sp.]|nr:type IV pilus modification protein PilV [Halioglobus sp.]